MTVCCVLFVYAINVDIAVLLHFCSPKDRQVLKNALASGGLRPPDPIPGLRTGGLCPPDPLPLWTPQTKNSSAAPDVASTLLLHGVDGALPLTAVAYSIAVI